MLGSSTVTTLESLTVPLKVLDFPTVTVCNNHQMTLSFMREIGVEIGGNNKPQQYLDFEYFLLTGKVPPKETTMNTGTNTETDTGTGLNNATVEHFLMDEKGQRVLCQYANKSGTENTTYFDENMKVCKDFPESLLIARKAASDIDFVMSVKYQNSEEMIPENDQYLTDFGSCTKLDPKELFREADVPESSNGKEMGLSMLLDTEKYRSWHQNDETKRELGAVLLIHGAQEKATTLLSAVEVDMKKLSVVSLSPVSVSTSPEAVSG